MNALLAQPKPRPYGSLRTRAPVSRASTSPAAIAAQLKGGCACGGTCPRCQAKTPVQTKLAISAPGDRYEREADHVATLVTRTSSEPGGVPITPVGHDTVSRSAAAPAVSGDIGSAVSHGTRGGGQPLDRTTRALFEPRFGRDLGAVRIHTGGAAARSASALGALAYTSGNDIVFADGHYSPHTPHGRWLLAHELTHTIQQSRDATPRIGRVAAPEIHSGATGLIQRVTCAGKSKSNCYGNCTHPTSGNPGNCLWSGTIANGCVCYEKPRLSPVKEVLYDLVMSALIAAAIVVSAAAIAAIIACLMGPCEVAALIAALGYAGAMIVLGIINSFGGDGTATGPTMATAGTATGEGAPA